MVAVVNGNVGTIKVGRWIDSLHKFILYCVQMLLIKILIITTSTNRYPDDTARLWSTEPSESSNGYIDYQKSATYLSFENCLMLYKKENY
ncbi:unnamed protein product [Rotaria socialis]